MDSTDSMGSADSMGSVEGLHVGVVVHSTEGAALCFLEFCREGFRRRGRNEHPDVTLDYIAMGWSMPAWDAGDYAAIRKTLARSVRRLAAAGAEFFVCPDNTAHIALEQPGPDLLLPGLHIAQVVAEEARARRYRRIGLLGARYLTTSDVYPAALGRWEMEPVVPGEADQLLVNRIIFSELVNGEFTEASRDACLRIIDGLAGQGCDAVALVCTELPLLITPQVSPLPTLDSTRLLARAAYGVAIGERPVPQWRGGPLTR